MKDASRNRGRRPRAPGVASRDTDASPFFTILSDLVARVPGAFGAVMVDGDGEAVDYTGELAPYDLKLAGAYWQIVLCQFRELEALHPLGAPRSLVVRAALRSFIAHALPDDYALVVLLGCRAGFSAATHAFHVCERALASEAGWRMRARSDSWFPVVVASSGSRRPTRVRDGDHESAVEVLGKMAGLSSSGDGWRVRLESGAELTLIREPGGHWYADESLASLSKPKTTMNRSLP